MKQDKSLKLILSILLILLIGIGVLSGCGFHPTTPDDTILPDETSGTEELSLRITFKEINLTEGNFSLKICSDLKMNLFGIVSSIEDIAFCHSQGIS